MLRSIFVLIVFTVLIGATIGAPFTGTLVWTWLSLMTPHKMAAGQVGQWPLNWLVAAVTLVSWLVSNEPKRLPRGAVGWLWLAFMADITITSLFALDPGMAWDRWDKAIKVMALGLLVSQLATNGRRVHILVWVVVLSLGYFGVKGGLFTIIHAGRDHVVGPANSSIADNNYFALALSMTLPLMYYLYLNSALRMTRIALAGAMVLTVMAVLGTYSRGGLVGLGVMGLFLWWRSHQRVLLGALAVALIIPAIQFMPAQWSERVNTIRNASEQQTFKTRFDAWTVALNLAQARPVLGGGFGATENADVYREYSRGNSIYRGDRRLPAIRKVRRELHLTEKQVDEMFPSDYTGPHAVHSIYFQVLADHGYTGFVLFVLLMAAAWMKMNGLSRQTRDDPNLLWLSTLASMMQVSMIAFFTAGAAVSMCYYDLPYLLIGLTLAMQQIASSAAGAQLAADTRSRMEFEKS